jgi:hypothetical protein
MLENPVLVEIGSERWTLAGVCLLAGGVLFVASGSLLAVLLVRYGKARRLTGTEASRVALHSKRSTDMNLVHGPAVGGEVRASFSIGDLRRARQAGNWLVFWGVPITLMGWTSSFGLATFAYMLWTGDYVIAVAYTVLGPLFLIACFMPWAAVYTKLE